MVTQRGQNRTEPERPGTASGWLRRHRLVLIVGLAACVLLGLLLRVADLKADPPYNFSWSFGVYTDEALNSYSARNLVLYGSWRVDDFFPFVVYPLLNFLVALAFRLFGIGSVQVKLASLLAGVATIGVMYAFVKQESGRLAGLIAALLTATCYPLVMYSRLGFAEPILMLLLLLAGLFFSKGLNRPWMMLLSGFLLAASVLLVKISAVFAVPVIVSVFAWELVAQRHRPGAIRTLGRALGWWCAGAAGAGLVWLLVVFLPYRSEYLEYVLRHSVESAGGHPEGVAAYIWNAVSVGGSSRLVPRFLLVAAVGFLFLPGLGRQRPGYRFLLAWILFATLLLGYMNYRPPRYELVIALPLVAGFAAVLGRLLEPGSSALMFVRPIIPKSVLYWLWLVPFAAHLTFHTQGFWGLFNPDSQAVLVAVLVGIALLLAAAGHLVFALVRREIRVRPVVRYVAAGVLLVLALESDFSQWSAWYRSRTYDVIEAGRQVEWLVPEDAVVAGVWAPALLANSRRRALCVTDWANVEDPVREYGVTHTVWMEEQFDSNLFWDLYPELMEDAEVLATFDISGFELVLTRLPSVTTGQQ